jgi:hypothetical protein
MPSIIVLFFFSTWFLLQKIGFAKSWRINFLFATVILGITVVFISEILSILDLLKQSSVITFWFFLSISMGYISLRHPKKITIKIRCNNFNHYDILLLSIILFIILITGAVAWIAPPNNWDSQTYHLSRVMHWLQNQNLNPYPTTILRQLHQNPWAEFAILNLQALSGQDYFANLVQWFSMIGVVIGSTVATKLFGGNRQMQLLAAFFSVTIPVGILQASSTQTDYILSFWLLVLYISCICLVKRNHPAYAFAIGGSLGLAILTKATAYLFALPIMLWVGIFLVKQKTTMAARNLASIIFLVFIVNAGHLSRNINLYQNPLGPTGESDIYSYRNDLFSPSVTASNSIRNIGLHLGTSNEAINLTLTQSINKIHELMSLDINDPQTTWHGTTFNIGKPTYHEDTSGNLIHVILIMATTYLVFFTEESFSKYSRIHAISLIIAFILFCTYLKWQPWHSRLHLPLFVLYAPLVGIFFSRGRMKVASPFLVILLTISALPYLFLNQTRPIIREKNIFNTSREKAYFFSRPDLYRPYQKTANILGEKKYSNIGIIGDIDFWEYPFWVMIGKKDPLYRIEHVNVENISQKAIDNIPNFTPDIVITIEVELSSQIEVEGIPFNKLEEFSPVSIYIPSK